VSTLFASQQLVWVAEPSVVTRYTVPRCGNPASGTLNEIAGDRAGMVVDQRGVTVF
jgi:hypothetical protein